MRKVVNAEGPDPRPSKKLEIVDENGKMMPFPRQEQVMMAV